MTSMTSIRVDQGRSTKEMTCSMDSFIYRR